MFRTWVITRHSFREAVVQPIYVLMLLVAAAILGVLGVLPFFTLGDDTRMFISVTLDVVLMAVLLAALFTTSKSIYEEIEDRTMLTLMSKPLRRWEVMVGKYLGIVLAAGLGVAVLGAVMVFCIYFRVPYDYFLPSRSVSDITQNQIAYYRWEHILGLLPQLVLTWLQVSVLAAIAIALSTRFSLVVNLPAVILLYLAGNLSRFIYPVAEGAIRDQSALVKGFVWALTLLLPSLETFDVRDLTVMTPLRMTHSVFAQDARAIAPSALWFYVAAAGLYAVGYCTFVLSLGLWSFHTRELGGGEG